MRHFPHGASQRNSNTRLSPPWRRKAPRDSSQLKNYRPRFQIYRSYIQVIGESHSEPAITSNDAMPKFQFAYRQFHSTETALIKIFNDLLLAADQGQVSALCLLVLTSAFDTVDHTLVGVVGAVVETVEYRTRNQKVAGSTHTRTWSTASNLEQVANLLCAQANSASYPQQDGK